MDERRLLLALGSLGALTALTLLRRQNRSTRSTANAKEESLEVSSWEEATLVAVLSLLLDSLGPTESCRLQCLCRQAQLGRLELRQLFQDWTGELCLAELTSNEPGSDADKTMRRAVAVATLAGRSQDLWRPDATGRPALVVAACSRPKARSEQLLRALLQQRAQPEARSPDGWNALMWSAQRGNCDDCRVLLEARASANAVSADGTSPLLCAVRADVAPLQVVKLLLTYKADPALVPMQSPFDEYVDMDVREALASAPKQR